MLATNLARVRPLHIVSHARLYEITGQLGERASDKAALARAARRAGAQQLVEGELYTARGGYRLDLRRIALTDGSVQSALRVDGRDLFALVDDATGRIAAEFGYASQALHLAEVTTHSVVAYRLYEEGLRGYYQGDMKRAASLFKAALAEDSLFPLPAYYYVLTEFAGQPIDTMIEARFIRLANRAPDRERLLMRARVASLAGDPSLRAIADTLAVRYPEEPDGHYLLGLALNLLGQPLESLRQFNRVIALDSLGLRGHSPQCRACDAFAQMISAYVTADSLAAAERVAREWVRLQPAAALPWALLAHVLEISDQRTQALSARQRAAAYEPGEAYDYIFPGMLAIRGGDFASADALLREQVRSAPPHVQRQALWFLIISLRYQGRFQEALQEARRFRALEKDPSLTGPEAQVLFEMGRGREAAALFRRLVDAPLQGMFRQMPSYRARQRVWYLTHTASSLAAAGDTNTLASLANTMEQLGSLSLYRRDRQTHHHVRGLLLAARGDHTAAATEFRAGTYWPLSLFASYTRTNLELARELLLLGRPTEAVHSLQLALANPLEASNYYLSRSDAHALLGRAFEAAGQRDSAIAHYRWTVNAWRNADPIIRPRRDSIRARLVALGEGGGD
jgi:tetratricopeptide (TPR) repeat protein